MAVSQWSMGVMSTDTRSSRSAFDATSRHHPVRPEWREARSHSVERSTLSAPTKSTHGLSLIEETWITSSMT